MVVVAWVGDTDARGRVDDDGGAAVELPEQAASAITVTTTDAVQRAMSAVWTTGPAIRCTERSRVGKTPPFAAAA